MVFVDLDQYKHPVRGVVCTWVIKKTCPMGRLPVMSGRGVSLIGLTVFVPIVKFTSVVIQTAKILTPKNVLAARPQNLPNGKMTFKRGAVSRSVQQFFRSTPAKHRVLFKASSPSNSGAGQDGGRRYFSISEDW